MDIDIYNKQTKIYIIIDLSNYSIDFFINKYRNIILKKNINYRQTHFTFMTIIFNNKYQSVINFLNNKKHIHKLKKLIQLYLFNTIFTPYNFNIWTSKYKSNYVIEYISQKKSLSKIIFIRKLIYNYIFLHIIFNKNKANYLLTQFIQNYKLNQNIISSKFIKTKINNSFISFIYKKNNKIYNLFSIPKHFINNNFFKYNITITDNIEIQKFNNKLYTLLTKNKNHFKKIFLSIIKQYNKTYSNIIFNKDINLIIKHI